MRNLYLTHRLSHQTIEEISEFSWRRSTITEALQKHKIKRDPLTSTPRYGEKIVTGQRVPHLGEQKNIKKMLSLREVGNSLRQIAAILNQQKITNRSGGNWDKTTIGTIIKREQEKTGEEIK